MTIEGIRNPESLRDFLYQQMRGARGDAEIVESEGASVQSSPATTQDDEALILLRDIRDELRAQRERIQHGDHGVHRAESE
jgi:hypothetical protein